MQEYKRFEAREVLMRALYKSFEDGQKLDEDECSNELAVSPLAPLLLRRRPKRYL